MKLSYKYDCKKKILLIGKCVIFLSPNDQNKARINRKFQEYMKDFEI